MLLWSCGITSIRFQLRPRSSGQAPGMGRCDSALQQIVGIAVGAGGQDPAPGQSPAIPSGRPATAQTGDADQRRSWGCGPAA